MKRYFDKRGSLKTFQVRYFFLKWDVVRAKPGKHTNLDAIWSGPYVITGCKEANAFKLARLNGEDLPIAVNEIHLKACA